MSPKTTYQTYTAQSASAFVSSLGVNVHLSRTATPYADTSKVVDAARYLGVDHFRDHISSAGYAAEVQVASKGIGFDIVYSSWNDPATFLNMTHDLASSVPGSIVAIEGANEVNNWPITFQGVTGDAAAASLQKFLYSSIKSDPVLSKLPVYNLTVGGISPTTYQNLGDLSSASDYSTAHIYYGGGQPTYGWNPLTASADGWDYWVNEAKSLTGGKPLVITETGASNAPGAVNGVDTLVQAKQILNSLMDAAASGSRATYLYELVDEVQDPSGTNVEAHYGLFNNDWTPKPAATAIHNLTTILDNGVAGSSSSGSVSLAVSGLPKFGHFNVFQEANGKIAVAVWAEPDIWDQANKVEIAAPATTVTLSFGTSQTGFAIFDPLQSSSPVKNVGAGTSVSVSVSDHPVIVELEGAASALTTKNSASATSLHSGWVTH
jgi:hypothetical protein